MGTYANHGNNIRMVRPKRVSVSRVVAEGNRERGSRMISFDFSPEQIAFQKTLVDFSRKVLLPGYRDRAASTEFPFEILRQLGELGVLGIGLPEKYGGTGAEDPVMLGLATETLAYGDVNVAAAPVQLGLSAAQLVLTSETIQQRYLPSLIAGDLTCGIALTEPQSGR